MRVFAELGERKGFDLHVMYGQCEATARMAVLPRPRGRAARHRRPAGARWGDHHRRRRDRVPRAQRHARVRDRAGRPRARPRGDRAAHRRPRRDHRRRPAARHRPPIALRQGARSPHRPRRARTPVARRRVRRELRGARRRRGRPPSGRAAATWLDGVRRAACRRCGAPRDAVRVVGVDELPGAVNGKPDRTAVLRLATGAGVGVPGATRRPRRPERRRAVREGARGRRPRRLHVREAGR